MYENLRRAQVATGDVRFRVREAGKEGSSRWAFIFKLAGGKVQSYDQFNDTGLAEAFRSIEIGILTGP